MGRFGFYRPYDVERGGMHREPWHLSFGALSAPALAQLSVDMLAEALQQGRADLDLQGHDLVRGMLDEIFERHVLNVATPYTAVA